MDELAFRGAAELVDAIRKREVSSRELLEYYLKRIAQVNPKLNAEL